MPFERKAELDSAYLIMYDSFMGRKPTDKHSYTLSLDRKTMDEVKDLVPNVSRLVDALLWQWLRHPEGHMDYLKFPMGPRFGDLTLRDLVREDQERKREQEELKYLGIFPLVEGADSTENP